MATRKMDQIVVDLHHRRQQSQACSYHSKYPQKKFRYLGKTSQSPKLLSQAFNQSSLLCLTTDWSKAAAKTVRLCLSTFHHHGSRRASRTHPYPLREPNHSRNRSPTTPNKPTPHNQRTTNRPLKSQTLRPLGLCN